MAYLKLAARPLQSGPNNVNVQYNLCLLILLGYSVKKWQTEYGHG